MKRKHPISLFGLGYVGSVTAACLAHKGHRVIGVDVNAAKVAMLDSGQSPIVETGMDDLVAEAHQACRLHATTDAVSAVCESDITIICVGTPSLRNGKLNLESIEHVCSEVGSAIRRKNSSHLIVLRSTVLPGTTDSVVLPALEATSGKRSGKDFIVCVNPEFMREGSAVADFLHPPLTILGGANSSDLSPLLDLYDWVPGRIFQTSIRTAEMVKHVSNAFHALKVSFINEVGTLCKQLSVDTEEVIKIFLADTRLNVSPAYLKAGFAFGGSCLPKDLRALTYRAKEQDVRLPLLESILPSNSQHIERALEVILRTGKKRLGVLGLSFKAGSDDLRESPLVLLIKRLLGEGCKIQIWDRDVSLGRLVGSNRKYIEEEIPHIGSLLCINMQEVIEKAEVVVIGSRAVARETLASYVRPHQIVIDLVNLEKHRRAKGIATYEGICW